MAKDKPADSTEVEALKSLLGDEAATLLSRGPNADAFRKATKELKEEKQEELVKQAKEKIHAALEAERKINALEKEFKGKLTSARKALRKLVNPLKALMAGHEPKSDGDGEEGAYGSIQEDGGGDGDGDGDEGNGNDAGQ